MTTLFRTLTTVREHSIPRRLLRLGTVGSVAVLVLGLVGSNEAHAQGNSLQITTLAQGSSQKKTPIMRVNQANDVLQALLVFQPGGETGWHIHPGPVVVVVKSGAITETHRNGCVTVHPTGSVFFETAGEVHNATNQTGGVAEVFATFISPAGAQPLIPVPDPGRVCHRGYDDQDDDDK
jgi:quercetin dioxygenase-like cupin family protein